MTADVARGRQHSRQLKGRLYEAAQQAIKQYILEHQLNAGDPLPTEGRLAQELGISRTSVREAVKALESLGILEARPGVGLFVRSFSFDPIVDNLEYSLLFDRHTLAELLSVRKKLEAGYIEDVAAQVTPEQVRVLRSVVDRMGERAALGERPAEMPEEDRFFHRTLYRGLGNGLLLKLLDVFWVVYRRLRHQANVEAIDPVRTWENHRRIVEVLERGDGAAARAAMLAHFAGIEERIGRAVGRTERTDQGDAVAP
ncbi:MAG: FadR family transcriptional regulator [Chloroflexi bacterium]|nr:FadR family transcriptional regulator [Chloroflexota bacterium]